MYWRARRYSFISFLFFSDLKFSKCGPAGRITSDTIWRISRRLSAGCFELDYSHLHTAQTHEWLFRLRSAKLRGTRITAGRSYLESEANKNVLRFLRFPPAAAACWTAGVPEGISAIAGLPRRRETAESSRAQLGSSDIQGRESIWIEKWLKRCFQHNVTWL